MDEIHSSRTRLTRAAGVLAGALAGIVAVVLAGTALAYRVMQPADRPLLEATHLPPLLTTREERMELRYDVYCARSEADAETPCAVDGTVFARAGDTGAYLEIDVREERGTSGSFVAHLPESIARASTGFSYYAVFRSDDTDMVTALPAGGAAAPQRSLPLGRSIGIALGPHDFGNEREATERVVDAGWGSGAAEVGLEQGRNLMPIGGSAFDIDHDDSVVVLDEANKRLLRWQSDGRTPDAVPLAINGTLADMSIGEGDTVYVLETAGGQGAKPLLRSFDRDGTERFTTPVAGRPSQVRVGPDGPVVLQSSSAQWMPAAREGQTVGVSEQIDAAESGRPLSDGRRIVILRHGNQVRVALVGGAAVQRAWLVTSETPLAEVQLAEPYGTGVVLVTRVFTDGLDEFVVLVLDRRGVVKRFSLDSADWAETAPLSRFRLRGSSLYQLGSTPVGLFVDRFELEVD